jgi:hypothetical protein
VSLSEVLLEASTQSYALRKEHADPLDDLHRHLSQEVHEHVVLGKPRASRDQCAAFGSSQQGIERSVSFVARVVSVVSHGLDHLAIGKPSLLTNSGALLWGEPVWGKEERGTVELGSYRT